MTKSILLLLLLLATNETIYGQPWKEYVDSAQAARTQRKFDKALNLYTLAKEILLKDSANTPAHANILNRIGNVYWDMGDYSQAEFFYAEAKSVCENSFGKLNRDYANACYNLGNLYRNTGNFSRALSLHFESKNIQEKISGINTLDYANCCNAMASLYSAMNKYQEAERLYEEAQKIRENILGKNHSEYVAMSNNLGGFYRKVGQYDKSLQKLLEAKKGCENLGAKNDEVYCTILYNLAQTYYSLKKHSQSEQFYIEALDLRKSISGETHPLYGAICLNFGLLYLGMKNYQKAKELTMKGMKIIELRFGKDNQTYSTACNTLGSIYLDEEKYSEAEALYLEAMERQKKETGENHLSFAKDCFNLGKLYWMTGDPAKSIPYYKKAFQIQYNELIQLFHHINEDEKEDYLDNILIPVEILYSIAAKQPDKPAGSFGADISIYMRNLTLSSSQQLRNSIHNLVDSSVIRKYYDWIQLREQFAFWLSKPLRDRKGKDKELEEKTNFIEKELTRHSANFKQQREQQDVTWKLIQQTLNPGEAAIEFANFQFYNRTEWTDSVFYIAFVMRKDLNEPLMIKLFEKKQLDSVLKKTKQLNDPSTINFRYAKSNAMYNLVWEPLEKHLAGINKIYYAPAGVLHELPFASLAKNARERLSDKYRLVRLNTTASVVNPETASISASDKLFLFGGVLYDGDTTALKQAAVQYQYNNDMASRSLPDDPSRGNIWQYLQNTKTEVKNIEKMALSKYISATVYTGWEATEESVKSLTGKNAPGILHIATHGFFFPDPKTKALQSVASEGRVFRQSDNPLLRSGLTMAGANYAWDNKPVQGIQDGILTAYEISNMYLPNTKLAVLSACKTGLGDIQGSEGVYGLQRAFKIAGVKNLVMSLWDVPDAATAEFMTSFYRKMFDGQSIEDAFYNTQSLMKDKYRQEPYKWAAWILVK